MDAKSEAARVARALKRWIMHEKGLSLRYIDEQTGHAYGYTSQLLGPGSPKLHLEGLFAVLDAIELPPQEFWQDVYRDPPEPEQSPLLETDQMDELVQLFREVARRAAQEAQEPSRRSPRARRRG